MAVVITNEQREQYREEGYMILERVIPDEHLALLRDECGGQIERMHQRMDEAGTEVIGINHRNKRYFVSNCYKERPILCDFLFSEVMADICKATHGPDAYLFHEQYVVKGKQGGMKFSWHQDSGYVCYPDHKPYLTCWCALDDMCEENGTVHVLPFSQSGIRSWVQHILEEGSNDKVGYFGDEPGITAIVPAGSIVAFTSINFHSSRANRTNALRRAYLGQYSAEPLLTREGDALWGNAEPFVRDGKLVVGDSPPDLPHRSDLVRQS